ncbi:hypothetical protein NMY22_g14313 [Coprinellus aureogranulatus]|nr:hypothetical protein NMY22_g14313 [Coprinellus aureogranulatus]
MISRGDLGLVFHLAPLLSFIAAPILHGKQLSPSFDPEFKLVTSPLFESHTLAYIRLAFATLTTAILIFCIAFQAAVLHNAQRFLSFFTNLSYFGLCGYFWVSGIHTFKYSRSKYRNRKPGYPLQKWPKVWQNLHLLLYTTVVTFPFIVTIVYWVLIAPSDAPFSDFFDGFSNITKHILNSVFALFELLLSNVGPHPWLNLLWTILILGAYVGVAYITFATQGFYPYSFLDPENGIKPLLLSIAGITVGQLVVFTLTWGIIKARQRVVFLSRGRRPNFNGRKRVLVPLGTATRFGRQEASRINRSDPDPIKG